MAVLAKVVLEDPPRLDELVPGTSPALADLVSTMMAKDREDRPRDADAVVAALEGVPTTSAGDDAPARPLVAITPGEQRLLSLVLVAAAGTQTTDETSIATEERARRAVDELASVAAAHGAELETLVDGTGLDTASHLLFSGHHVLAHQLLELIEPDVPRFTDDDPAVGAAVYRVQAVRAICAGDLAAGLVAKRASVEAYERAGDVPGAHQQRGNLGSVYVSLGAFAEAETLLREATAAADRLGLPSVSALAAPTSAPRSATWARPRKRPRSCGPRSRNA